MISHRHKVIFVHIPKTGGTSISSILWPRPRRSHLYMGFVDEFHNKYSTGGMQHLIAKDIKTEVGEVTFAHYLKFSVLRNPYSKAISQYHYMATRSDLREFIGMNVEDPFEKYLELIQRRDHVQWAPQHTFIVGDDGELLVNRILRFENFESEVGLLFRELGIRASAIPHINKSVKQNSAINMTKEAIETINKIYEKDFRLFNYEQL